MLTALRELIGLSRAAALARKGQAPRMEKAKRLLVRARRRAEGAQLLRDEGHLAEALRLARAALEDAERAALLAGEPAPPGQLTGGDPELDAEVGNAHLDRLRETLRTVRRMTRHLAPIRSSPLRVRLRRVGRGLLALALVAAAAFGVYRRFHPAPRIEVSASHERGNGDWPASFAFDGDPHTEWMLEDRARGWIQFDFMPPRDLEVVRIMNGINPPYYDRAVREYRVEARVASDPAPVIHAGRFDTYSRSPQWQTVELHLEQVRSVRIYAESFHDRGVSLAEVSFER